MNILHMIYYYTKALLTDKMTIFLKIVTPIIMMLILGTALKSEFTADMLEVSHIVILAEDNIYDMIEQNTDSSYLEIAKGSRFEEAMKDIDSGKADAIVKIDINEQDEGKDRTCKIEIYTETKDSMKKMVVDSSVNDLKNISNLILVIGDEVADMDTLYVKYMEQEAILTESNITMSGNIPRSMDYYGVTMLVITLMSGAAFSCDYFGSIFSGSIGMRMKSSCVRVYENYIGMFASMFLVNMIQGTFTMLIMKYLCGVDWGSHMIVNIVIVISTSAMATGIGIFFSTAFHDVKQASKVLNMLLQVFAFIAGGYIKLDFGILKYVSPNYYAQSALFHTIYGGDFDYVKMCLGIFWGVTIAASGIAILIARRRKEYVA